MPDGHRPAAEPHPRRALQHRLRDVQLPALDGGERGECGGGVGQQRRAVAGLQQDRGPGELRQRGRRRTGHRVHEPVRHQLLGAREQGRRLVGSGAASTARASSNAPVPIERGHRLPPHPRAEEAVHGRAAGEHAAVGEDGGGHRRRPGRDRRYGTWPGGREHLVGLGEGEVEIAGAERGLGAPGRQLDGGGACGDGRRVQLVGAGKAGAQGLVARRREDARHPSAGDPGAEEAAGGGEDVAAALELALGQRPAHLEPGRGRCALQHGGRDERDRRALRGEQALGARGFDELVERGGVGGDVRAQHGDEEVGLERGAERPDAQEVAHAVREAVDGVAQLGQQAAGRAGRDPSANASGRGRPARSGRRASGRRARGGRRSGSSTRSTTASDGRGSPVAEHVRHPGLHARCGRARRGRAAPAAPPAPRRARTCRPGGATGGGRPRARRPRPRPASRAGSGRPG